MSAPQRSGRARRYRGRQTDVVKRTKDARIQALESSQAVDLTLEQIERRLLGLLVTTDDPTPFQ